MSLRAPPPLRAGSVVAVVAPATWFDREELFRGLAWLATRYRLRIDDRRIFGRTGYLAGPDEERTVMVAQAMQDTEVDAILCARGGYGAMRILDALPWDAFAERPKPIIGFSDITALHVTANARGIVSVHGPNATGLGRSISPAERAALIAALEGHPLPSWTNLDMLRAGEARGTVVGGNLAIVTAMAAANRLCIPEGAIVVLEDVTERPYRIDRMLTSLRLGGHFARAGAVVFGGFTQCDPGPDGITVDDVLRDFMHHVSFPVVSGAPFGHGAPNSAFRLGAEATLQGDRLDWS